MDARPGNLNRHETAPLPKALDAKYFAYGGRPDHITYRREFAEADGSCLFFSLARILNKNDFSNESVSNQIRIGHNLRRTLQRTVRPETWFPFWRSKGVDLDRVPSVRDIRSKMRDTKVWADVWIIRWCMEHLNLNLYFFDMDVNNVYCGVENSNGGKNHTGAIAWVRRSHFEPVVEHNNRTGETTALFTPDHPLPTHVLKVYEGDGCARLGIRHRV